MEESEKRANAERFLDGLVKEWSRLYLCQSGGTGHYAFNRKKLMNLIMVQQLVRNLKSEKRDAEKRHITEAKRLRSEVQSLRNRIFRGNKKGEKI